MDKELQTSAGASLHTIYKLHFSICGRLRYLQLQSVSKGFWMYLVVVLGGKTLNKLKKYP